MEIDSTDEQGEVLHAWVTRKVVRICEELVVKKCTSEKPRLGLHEASNLHFVAANITIPAPKVHYVRWEDGEVAGLVMGCMPGKALNKVW